jgi:hypothetical protein
MGAFQFHNYVNDTIKLSRSLVIKDEQTAFLMNKQIAAGFGKEYTNDRLELRHTWRYYKNLAGEEHYLCLPGTDMPLIESGERFYTNVKMTVFSYDTKSEITFNKETIYDHPITLGVYMSRGKEYTQLCERYPNNEVLINGILLPVAIDKALLLDDGSVLTYDKRYVEPQEKGLIPHVDARIKQFIRRWRVRAFNATSSLYDLTFMAQLYAMIPTYILNYRASQIKSEQAHSFHIKEYFESNGNLDVFYRYLTKTQSLWLYKNLHYLLQNPGKQNTLDTLAQVLFASQGYPLDEILLIHDTREVNKKSRYPALFERRSLLGERAPIYSSNAVITSYLNNYPGARDNRWWLTEHGEKEQDKMTLSLKNRLKTKWLYTGSERNTTSDYYDRLAVFITNWGYEALHGRYSGYVLFTDPKRAKRFNVTYAQAYVYLMISMARTSGTRFDRIPLL